MAKNINISHNIRVEPTLDFSIVNQGAYDPLCTRVILDGEKLTGFVSDNKIVMDSEQVHVRLQATSSHIGRIMEMVGKTDVPLTLRVHGGGDASNYHDFNYKVKVEEVYPESLGSYVPVIRIVLQKTSSQLGERHV